MRIAAKAAGAGIHRGNQLEICQNILTIKYASISMPSVQNSSIQHRNAAVSYARFSSGAQAKGSSIERQRKMFDDWLKNNKDRYYISELSRNDEGVSAFNQKHLKQGELGRIVSAIEAKLLAEGDVLVVEAIDRLSRAGGGETVQLLQGILTAGVSVITLEDGKTYSKDSLNNSDLYILVGKALAAREYSERLGTRVREANKAKERKAKEGIIPEKLPNIPAWIDRSTKQLNETATVIKKLIDYYKAGKGTREVAHYAQTVLNYRMADRTFGRYIRSETLLGHWRGVKCFDALLTEQEFYELQQQIELRSRSCSEGNPYLLSSLVVCSKCGRSFVFRVQQPKSTLTAPKGSPAYESRPKIVYGNCRAFLHDKSCSNSVSVPYEVAQLVYDATAPQLIFDLAYMQTYDLLSREALAGLIEKRVRLQSNYNSRKRLFEASLADTDDDLDKLKQMRKELDELSAEIEARQRQTTDHEYRREEFDQLRREFDKNGSLASVSAAREFGLVSQADLDRVQHQVDRLQNNTVELRSALKEAGYKIVIDRADNGLANLTCSHATGIEESWFVQRRSQKLGCYLVQHKVYQAVDADEDDELVYGFVVSTIECRR